jgi:hypothetical protein
MEELFLPVLELLLACGKPRLMQRIRAKQTKGNRRIDILLG